MMKIDPATWPTLSKLLDDWLDQPVDSRSGWLENLGPEYSEVLPALRQLLSAQTGAGDDFLRTLPKFVEASPNTALGFQPGTAVGPYRLIRELGQGGMGVVWLAERADGEMKRSVAIKLPFLSLHNRSLADRFTRERDILAQLTHSGIARLYDAGIDAQGQPFLALEYVEGEKITVYCDQRNLGLEPRLQLFLKVLRAVQYAHSNLIVHRDLKPANILVTNDGEVRLLDFGIAKLLTEGEASETDLTRLGGRALTPDYASPEQITGSAISTATDIYSLGVVLYELLTGARPYKLRRDTRSGLEDAILEAEPERPSHAAGTRLARGVKGDIDAIVLKALSKQPQQRYASADAFAQDIERHLDGQAVLAQPESAWYRARKFIGRNKAAAGATAAVIAALSIGLGVALWEAHIAQIQSRTAQTVQSFLLDIFRANSNEHADPVKARQTTARELLDIGAKKIEGSLQDAPAAKLSLLETLFHLYADLGLQDRAFPLGRSRVALAKSIYGPNHPEVARALVELAVDSGESSFANVRPELLKEAEKILDRNGDSTSRTRALYYVGMGGVLVDTNLETSATYAGKAIQLYQRYPPSLELVATLNLLGQRQVMQEQFPEGIATLSQAASVANSLQGEARRPLPAIYAVLAEAQRHMLDIAGAEKSARLALDMARSLKGEDSVDVLQTEWRLGNFLVQTSRIQEGLALLKKSVDLAVRTRGPGEVFHTPMVRRAYGVNLLRYGSVEEGMLPLTQAMEAHRQAKRSGNQDFAITLEAIVPAETDLGHYRQAQALLDEAFAIRAIPGQGYSRQLDDALMAKARLLLATGKAAEALAVLRQIPEKADDSGKITYSWLNVSLARAEANLAMNRPDAAVDQAALVQKRIIESGLAPYFKRWEAEAAFLQGRGLLLRRNASDARPLLQHAVQLGSEVLDPQHSLQLADSEIALADCLLDLGNREEAQAWLLKAKAIHGSYKDLGDQFKSPLRKLAPRIGAFGEDVLQTRPLLR